MEAWMDRWRHGWKDSDVKAVFSGIEYYIVP